MHVLDIFLQKMGNFRHFFSKLLCNKKIIHNFTVKTYLSLNIYEYEKIIYDTRFIIGNGGV